MLKSYTMLSDPYSENLLVLIPGTNEHKRFKLAVVRASVASGGCVCVCSPRACVLACDVSAGSNIIKRALLSPVTRQVFGFVLRVGTASTHASTNGRPELLTHPELSSALSPLWNKPRPHFSHFPPFMLSPLHPAL